MRATAGLSSSLQTHCVNRGSGEAETVQEAMVVF